MWYLYDDNYFLISKSHTEPEESNKVFYNDDLELDLFTVVVGNIQEIDGVPTITYLSRKIKSNYKLAMKVKEQQDEAHQLKEEIELLKTSLSSLESGAAESEIETDYRLSMLELGLA